MSVENNIVDANTNTDDIVSKLIEVPNVSSVFDDRMTRRLDIMFKKNTENYNYNNLSDGRAITITPGILRDTFIYNLYETPDAINNSAKNIISNLDPSDPSAKEEIDKLNAYAEVRSKAIEQQKALLINSDPGGFSAGFSFIHPYALLRLNGVRSYSGGNSGVTNVIDINSADPGIRKGIGKWYENMSDPSSENTNYAKNPTTSDIINWGAGDVRGRFPYMFQDFVFCKYWNKIENNRMITLRRYPAPVNDMVEPSSFEDGDEWEAGKLKDKLEDISKNTLFGPTKSKKPFSPLVTAVTYFGDGTGNNIKDLLSFSYQYNWKDLESNLHDTNSTQIEEGQIAGGGAPQFMMGGLGMVVRTLGVMDDFQSNYDPKNHSTINPRHAIALPPDPYSNGPYENRIVGPVNVIMNTIRRERGLKFTQDGLKVVFEYTARPIAHVNNKAILLDLLSNILAMTYSSGTFFGGALRYNSQPAVYPWKNVDTLNKLYDGKIFGKESAFDSFLNTTYENENSPWVFNFTSSLINNVKSRVSDILSQILGKSTPDKKSGSDGSEQDDQGFDRKKLKSSVMNTAGRVVAAKFLKGSTVPYLHNAKALLTGEPVGDWHLTIGNPLNPIATIGNLIVKDSRIEFSEELGPDDFPIGFKATITLAHGMGRDKDAIESMFNRGTGRIYILPDDFTSSADSETTVDKNSGNNNKDAGTFNINRYYNILKPAGEVGVTDVEINDIINSKDVDVLPPEYKPLLQTNRSGSGADVNIFKTESWAMHNIL